MSAETVEEEDGTVDFMRSLAEAGYEDVLLLDVETAERILTPRRRELLEEIEEGKPEGVRDLARKVDRDGSSVHEDLTLLFENGVVEFREESNRKIPDLAHEHVMVRPIV